MKKAIILGLSLFIFLGCGNNEPEINGVGNNTPVAEATPSSEEPLPAGDEAETSEVGESEIEYVRGYQSITWWNLLSEEEFLYYTELNASFTDDPTFVPENDPPAPQVNRNMDGQQVRIPGYIVGVDTDPDDFSKVSSFLFVPYQGACMHVPAPPENQTIFVEVDEPVMSDPYTGFWLYGTINIEQGNNDVASYFYTFKGDSLEFYF